MSPTCFSRFGSKTGLDLVLACLMAFPTLHVPTPHDLDKSVSNHGMYPIYSSRIPPLNIPLQREKDYQSMMGYRCCLAAGYIVVAVFPVSSFVLPAGSPSSASHASHLARRTTMFYPKSKTSTVSLNVYDHVAGIDSQLLFDTWEWNANLASPAALVAGAVLATLIDGREAMRAKITDKRWVINLKKTCRLLLLSSFGLEVLSIFVTVVMGTLLLSLGDIPKAIVDTTANSPMGLMYKNFELEFLTARITFLQGLFHWLASVALEILIPRKMEGQSTRRMNRFISSALMTIVIAMLSFLNRHVVFYENYMEMLKRCSVLWFKRFVWPIRPLTVLFVPSLMMTTFFCYRAFISPPDDVDEDGPNI